MEVFTPIDFEYYNTAERVLEVVCGSYGDSSKWTHLNPQAKEELKKELISLKGTTFLAYNVVAEARVFLSLGLNPLEFNWIDLYLEYRCLSNHNDNYAYGKQLINGRTKFTKKPLPKHLRKTEADEKKADASKQEYGLGSAVYKTLGIVIDNEFKTEMRNILIKANSGVEEDILNVEKNKADISLYCDSDTVYLKPMLNSMISEYKRLLGSNFNMTLLRKDMEVRSKYACRTAMMEMVGYPINYKNTKNFSSQVANILWECQTDINSQFEGVFVSDIKSRPLDLTWKQDRTRELLDEWKKKAGVTSWVQTEGKKDSLSLKAFKKHISFSHSYPRGNFIAQMQRYLTLKQGLNGFSAKTNSKKNFWDSVGKDRRVRPYMGIYTAQSSRSQPSASSFIPLKSAWMRSLIEPELGFGISGIDFASQEFLLSALMSGDWNMIQAYASGDVYLAFGKAIGYIPMSGTKKTHKKERDDCKAVVLGLSYDMSEYGLAIDLSEKFGRKVSTEEALGWINKHKKAYPIFWKWKERMQREYKAKKHIRLPDGWMMWGDNENFRSSGNARVQGMGACIMRKAVELAQDRGLTVIYTLHDAIYIQYAIENMEKDVTLLATCMDEAFRFYFNEKNKAMANVRLDADIWSQDYPEEIDKFELKYSSQFGKFELPVKQQKTYIDERAEDEYNKFSKYFNDVNFLEEVF